jgi:hypothetical protein
MTVGATAMVVLVIALIIAFNGPKRGVPQATSGQPANQTIAGIPTDVGGNGTNSSSTVATNAAPAGGASSQGARTNDAAKAPSPGKLPERTPAVKKEAVPAEAAVASATSAAERTEPKTAQAGAKTRDEVATDKKEPALSPEAGAGDSAAKAATSVPAEAKSVASVAPAAPAPAKSNNISQSELTNLIKRFEFVYEAGDIEQFLRIFDDDVRTNDRFSKDGLREDYEDLFKTTDMRRMVLSNVTWEMHDSRADGWGNFEVKVRKTGEQEVKEYKGSLTFYVEKINGQVRIKRLYHGQWRAS